MTTITAGTATYRYSKTRIIAYWLVTGLITFELVHGALWDFNLINKGYVYGVLTHLGYPLYLAAVLGACKLAAAAVMLIPGWPLLKEWAYAGVVILFGGAFGSHLLAGDGPGIFIWSLIFALMAVGSWALRPPGRRVAGR